MFNSDLVQHRINKYAYWILLSTYVFLLVTLGSWFVIDINSQVVPAETTLGLPKYTGSCAPLIRIVYGALKDNREISKKLHTDPNRNKIVFKSKVIGGIAGAFTYSSKCTDPNAIGLMLVSDANITLDAAFNQIISFNEAVPLARSYFNEAVKIGYFKNHAVENYLLSERIKRNEFRLKIEVPF